MATNAFVEIVQRGVRSRWCMQLGCTTCGTLQFRSALREFGGMLGGPLCEALCALDPPELMAIRGWADALEIAIRDLPIGEHVNTVLSAWLPGIGKHVRFDDLVLYQIVRHLNPDNPVREAWIRAAISVAVVSKDHSLVETLLLILRREVTRFPDLVDAARQLSASSKQIERVLQKACGVAPAV